MFGLRIVAAVLSFTEKERLAGSGKCTVHRAGEFPGCPHARERPFRYRRARPLPGTRPISYRQFRLPCTVYSAFIRSPRRAFPTNPKSNFGQARLLNS
jgi:hypothetical protein